MTGTHRDTIMRLVVEVGDLSCQRFQCDEISAYIGTKQKQVTKEDDKSRGDIDNPPPPSYSITASARRFRRVFCFCALFGAAGTAGAKPFARNGQLPRSPAGATSSEPERPQDNDNVRSYQNRRKAI
jgi:hypothetical protein